MTVALKAYRYLEAIGAGALVVAVWPVLIALQAPAPVQAAPLQQRGGAGQPYPVQRREICGAPDRLNATFGISVRFFRPPYGSYDTTTLRAVHDCGLQAAFSWRGRTRYGRATVTRPAPKASTLDRSGERRVWSRQLRPTTSISAAVWVPISDAATS